MLLLSPSGTADMRVARKPQLTSRVLRKQMKINENMTKIIRKSLESHSKILQRSASPRLPRHAKTSLFTKHLPGRVTSPFACGRKRFAPPHGSCHSCRSRKRRVESSDFSLLTATSCYQVEVLSTSSGWKPTRSTCRDISSLPRRIKGLSQLQVDDLRAGSTCHGPGEFTSAPL